MVVTILSMVGYVAPKGYRIVRSRILENGLVEVQLEPIGLFAGPTQGWQGPPALGTSSMRLNMLMSQLLFLQGVKMEMMETPKVPKPQFDAVLKKLLAGQPLPMAQISPKRSKAKRPRRQGLKP